MKAEKKKLKVGLPKVLVIDRKIWGRGKTGGALRKKVGKTSFRHCCLGILALKQGCTPEEIHDQGSPANLVKDEWGSRRPRSEIQAAFPGMIGKAGDTCKVELLIAINDDKLISGEEREAKLKKAFADKFGVKVRFTN